MDLTFEIFGFAFTTIILIFIFIRIRHLYLSNDRINDAIVNYYEEKGLYVNDVLELSITEKIKYGVSIIPIFRLYSYYFGFFINKIEYVRKVDVTDEKGIDYTKYIEISVQGQDIISFKEFASYDI